MDPLPISALQHLLFCERQCALIHLEGVWADNRQTAEGRALHEAVDRGSHGMRGHVLVCRDVPVCSERLGLFGRADVVEFRTAGGTRVPFPVEYKRGQRRPRLADEVQLCAQAVCLEEMMGTAVPRGAVFHAVSRRRRPVEFDEALRAVVERSTTRLRDLLQAGRTPVAIPGARCRSCSLRIHCLPEATSAPNGASRYLASLTSQER